MPAPGRPHASIEAVPVGRRRRLCRKRAGSDADRLSSADVRSAPDFGNGRDAMMRSMTGFGQAAASPNGYKIQIDIRSVNHRYQEISIRLPREWIAYEDAVKKRVQRQIRRGRVELYASIAKDPETSPPFAVNWAVADAYVNMAREMASRYSLAGLPSPSELLALPEVLRIEEVDDERKEELAASLLECVDSALDRLVAMREAEGAALKEDLINRIRTVEKLRESMFKLYPEAVTQAEQKLRQRIASLLKDVSAFDEQRFLMEAALMADKMSIDEELTRLESHIRQMEKTLEQSEPIGRKLDFLVQEMNREANTIGAKANDAAISGLVVEMKAELEKMREQIQNIE